MLLVLILVMLLVLCAAANRRMTNRPTRRAEDLVGGDDQAQKKLRKAQERTLSLLQPITHESHTQQSIQSERVCSSSSRLGRSDKVGARRKPHLHVAVLEVALNSAVMGASGRGE